MTRSNTQIILILQILVFISSDLVSGQNITRPEPISSPMENKVIVPSSPSPLPICIVGSGLTGLGLGRILQRKGRQVKIFDERDHPGGKIQTYRQSDEIQVELCPVLFGLWQSSLASYVRAFNLNPVHFDLVNISGYDAETGKIYPELSLPTTIPELTAMADAAIRYIFHRDGIEKNLRFGYLDTTPDLFVSLETWLDERNLGVLKPHFSLALTNAGYGDLSALPAIYGLKFLDRDLFLAKITNAPTIVHLRDGLDVLAQRLAEPLNVQLNRRATHVQRVREGHIVLQTVDTRVSDHEMSLSEQNCSKLILAFPPLLKHLEKICVDLTQEEKDVLAHVKVHKFASAAISIPNMKRKVYLEATNRGGRVEPFALGVGEPIAFGRQNFKKRHDIFSSFSWIRGDTDEGLSENELEIIDRRLNELVRKFHPESKVLYQKHTEYFPHVNLTSIVGGFYQKFDAIQGRGGLYYATTLLEFEQMDGALKTAEGMVRRYSL